MQDDFELVDSITLLALVFSHVNLERVLKQLDLEIAARTAELPFWSAFGLQTECAFTVSLGTSSYTDLRKTPLARHMGALPTAHLDLDSFSVLN